MTDRRQESKPKLFEWDRPPYASHTWVYWYTQDWGPLSSYAQPPIAPAPQPPAVLEPAAQPSTPQVQPKDDA